MLIGVDLASQPDQTVITAATYTEALAKLKESYVKFGPVLSVVGATLKEAINQLVQHEKEQVMKALLGE